MSLRDVKYKAAYVSGVDNLVKDFYVPTLEKSVLYQRRTGYFNSRALAMAARGLSGLLKNNGKMQLLCSVQLDKSEEEVLRDPVTY
ncbi:MAG: restriction endonuclease subunit R, partial [Thermoplasmata archaeon]|nr:restriction endonuclease subunit R [Thermoplasmata archaeon]